MFKSIRLLLIIMGVSLSHVIHSQNQLNLDQPQTGNQDNVAKQRVQLLPGYKYTPTVGNNMKAYIDPNLDGQLNYNTLFTESDILNRTLDTNKEVGTIDGNHSVSPSGAATYGFQLKLPPGSHNMVPVVGINYSSQGGEGVVGMGWGISGLSSISRIPDSWFLNGESNPVSFDNDDQLSIDGVPLIPQGSGGNLTNNKVYKKHVEDFSELVYYTSNGGWFELTTKTGLRYEYGRNSSVNKSKFLTDNGGEVMSWNLNKIIDCYGNYIEFVYENNDRQLRILEINYTGNGSMLPYNSIKFIYGEKPNTKISYQNGQTLNMKYILTDIKITAEDNELMKNYSFHYGEDGYYTFLNEVIEYGDNGDEFNATQFHYEGMNGVVTVVDANIPNTGQKFSGDYDGDGADDLIISDDVYINGTQFYGALKYYSKPNSSLSGSFTLTGPTYNIINYGDIQAIKNGSKTIPGNAPSHFNFSSGSYFGNGKSNISLIEFNNVSSLPGYYEVDREQILGLNSSNSSLTTNGTNNTDKFYPKNYFGESPVVTSVSGDFNGDGYSEILQHYYDLNEQKKYVCYSPGNSPVNVINSPLKYTFSTTEGIFDEVEFAASINFDGDAKADVFTLNYNPDTNSPVDRDLYIKSLSHIDSNGNWVFQTKFTIGLTFTDPEVYIVDFNGDGLSEILIHDNDSGEWRLYFSDGMNGLTNVTLSYLQNNLLFDDITIGDFNGDGKTDMCFINKIVDDPNVPSFNYDLNIIYSKGQINSSSFEFDQVVYPDIMNGQNVFNNLMIITTGDFNGDGITDVYVEDNAFDNYIIYLPTNYRLLKNISNGFNKTTKFNYIPLSDDNSGNKNLASGGEIVNYSGPMRVVSSVEEDDSFQNGTYNTTEYKYHYPRFHIQGKSFLGFLETEVYDPNLGIRTFTDYEEMEDHDILSFHQTRVLLPGFPGGGPAGTTERHESSYHSRGTNRYWLRTDEIKSWDWLNKRTVHTINEYDNGSTNPSSNGNLTQKTTKIYGGADNNISNLTNSLIEERVVVNSTFVNKCNSPYAALPESTTTTNTRTNKDAVSSEISYSSTVNKVYNNDGSINQLIEFPGLSKQLTTTFSDYNSFGQPERTSISTSGMTTRFTISEYDTKGRYVIRSENALGHESSMVYDNKFGVLSSSTTPTGLITKFYYDSFGRRYKTTTPENYDILETWHWDIQNGGTSIPTDCNNAIYYNLVQSPLTGDNKTWFDNYLRALKTETQGWNNAWLRMVKSYDSKGNVKTETNEFYLNETPVIKYNHFEEGTNRLDYLDVPGIGITQYNYSHTTDGYTENEVTTPDGKNATSIIDPSGKTYKTIDNLNTEMVFNYFSNGQVKEIISDGEALSSFTYDEYTRQTTLTDQNTGTITYEYNAFDELVYQEDSKGNITTTLYDILGRPYYINTPEGPISNTYVVSGNGLGAIKSSTHLTDNVSEEYYYDHLDRNYKTTFNVQGETFSFESYYDEYGRVTKRELPTGFEVNYEYNSLGFLYKIRDYNNSLLYELKNINGRGNITSYDLGNNSTGTLTYDLYDFPTNFKVPNMSFDETYSFDVISGNLTSRTNNINGLSDHFQYDELNRLSGYTPNGGTVSDIENIHYSSNGNILEKPDAGIYKYDDTKVHAVSAVTDPGNLISSDIQNIDYNSYQQPITISEGNKSMTLLYGIDQNRIKTTLEVGGQISQIRYRLGEFEKIEDKINNIDHYSYSINLGGNASIRFDSNTPGTNGSITSNYRLSDYLGSYKRIGNTSFSYDAWGRERDPLDWSYLPINGISDIHNEGYTGHEHYPEFGLINMNGRMYDPLLARMLSPDNYVSSAGYSQSYNRYSYVLNNPLKYNDPSGETPALAFAAALKGAGISFLANGINNAIHGNSFFQGGFQAAAFGALGGLSANYIGGLNFGGGFGGAVSQASFHAVNAGIMSGWQAILNKGDVAQEVRNGFISSGISSLSSSWLGSKITDKTKHVGAKVIGVGTLSGGLSSLVSGGSFYDGARNGLIVSALNHLEHMAWDPPGIENRIRVIEAEAFAEAYGGNFMDWYNHLLNIQGDAAVSAGFWASSFVGGGAAIKGLQLVNKISLKSFLKGGKTFAQYKASRGGTETLARITTSSGTQRISTEFHHLFITQRMQRAYNLPNWLVNNRLNVWKLNTIQHALVDSHRFKFLRKGIKKYVGWFKKYNWFTKF